MKILVLNGPNLNLLGTRDVEVYGRETLGDVERMLEDELPDVEFSFLQSNHEGALIDALHAAPLDGVNGVILNAGGFSHTSVALRDAVAAVSIPVVEVHISNVFVREDFRRHSLLAPVCAGSITGLGTAGYRLAADHLARQS